MRFHLCAVGRRVPAWVERGYQDYARRLPGGARLELHPVAGARGDAAEPARARAEEGRRLRAAVPARAHRVALDVGGRGLTTEDLVGRATEWNRTGAEVAFLVGGPEGLERALLDEAEEHWSLSPLTLPHALVRVVLAEQLYRALSVVYNHPYHR